jgi:hypothetical protein
MKFVTKVLILLLLGSYLAPPSIADAEKASAQKKSPARVPKQVKDELDRVISASPALASLTLESTDFSEGSGYYGPDQWRFSFADPEDDEDWGTYADVEVDAKSGRLFEFEINHIHPEPKNPPADAAAKRAANDFLAGVWGDHAKHYRLSDIEVVTSESDVEVERPVKTMLSYDFYIQDIKVEDFDIYVMVDGEGRVIELRNDAILSPEPTEFPDPQKAISASRAKEIYKKWLDMSLAYVWKQEDGKDEGQPALIYGPRFYDGAFDAFTGEISNEVNSWIYEKPQRISVQPKGIPLVVKSRKEAEKLISKEFGVSVKGLRYVPDSSRTDDEDEEESPYIRYAWKPAPKSKKRVYVSLVTERETGRVVEYEYDEGIPFPKQKISFRKAQQKALDILTRYVDKETDELLLTYSRSPYAEEDYPDWIRPKPKNQYTEFMKYSFGYADLYQSIEVDYSRYSVEINPETGNLSALSLWNDLLIDLPKPDGVITAEQAAEIYENANPLKLVYVWPTYYEQVRPSPVLLFIPRDYEFYWIDAFTGKLEKND